ncbi:MAG TPA: hypothetical protein VF618_02870 [Thermoanaerobaculia bacterium]
MAYFVRAFRTVLLFSLLQAEAVQAEQLAITLTAREVRVTGATPDAAVIVTGYEEKHYPSQRGVTRRQRIERAGANGAATRHFESDISPRSFWIAVDVKSGAVATAAPAGMPLAQRPLPEDLLKTDNNGQLKKLVSRLAYASFLLVRPGEGAWEMKAGDGGASDGDHSVDGKIETDLDQFEPMVDVTDPPKKFERGDVLVIMMPETMSFFLHRVGESK